MRHFSFLLLIALLSTLSPTYGQISGASTVCEGSVRALTATPSGGSWTSSAPATATVDGFGNVSGIVPGTAIITYSVLSTDYTLVVTVNPLPAAITGTSFGVCVGSSITLSCATLGGTWSSSDLGMASVGATNGIVTGLTASPIGVNITYTAPNTCSRSAVVTVNNVPAAISGSSTVCVGYNILLSDASSGGTWSTSNAAIAVVVGTGLVTGVAAGAVNITYQLSNGCYNVRTMTVNSLPAAITGPSSVCSGSIASLSSATPGGVWSASGPYFTINATTGVVSGILAGTGTVTYAIGSTGCHRTTSMAVNAMPGPITGTFTVCPSATTILNNTVPGGMWVSGSTSVATVTSGIASSTTVTGISGGTTLVSYITGPGCLSTAIVSVNPSPNAGVISGPGLVCTGTSVTLVSTESGGYWTSGAPSVASVTIGGTVTGLAAGTATITYALTTICGTDFVTYTVTVSPTPTTITGSTVLCGGTTTTLYNGVPGGVWSSGSATIASIDATTGVVTGLSAGTSVITYLVGGGSGCLVTRNVTVNLAPGAIAGAGGVCVGGLTSLSNATAGGIWNSSNPSIAIVSTIGTSTGVVTGMAAGTSTISYSIVSCVATKVVTVNALPIISATAVPDACGGGYVLSASGGGFYSWAPSAGLSCPGCAVTSVTPTTTTTYTVSGSNSVGCANTATVTVNGNRISGYITFSSVAPTVPSLKVWLIKYNPSDSSITATDSTLTCLDGTQPYYQFDSKPAGNYMVKAKLMSSVPGSSDYIPTYGSSTVNWYLAATIVHTANADAQNINMIFGTVPSGPGFISGYVYSGAGKGTAGVIPEAGMIVYLKSAADGRVLTYTYTDGSGNYSFSGIGYGNYIISPEEYDYYTTPSAPVSLSVSAVTINDVTFKKHTGLHTIYPYNTTGVNDVRANAGITIFPNPASDFINIVLPQQQTGKATVRITDVSGRELINEVMNLGGAASNLDISKLNAGIYLINIVSDGLQYSDKLVISK